MSFWDKYVIKGFFGWENSKWFIRQIRDTFSNKPSYFSRKRIESFFIFINATILLDIWLYKNIDDLNWEGMVAIYGAQMIYAGYQVTQIRKDIINKTTPKE